MPLDMSTPEIQFAVAAAERAGRVSRTIQQQLAQPALSKEDRSPVTVADFAVQALLGWMLERELNGDTLVAEENTRVLRTEQGASTLEQVTAFLTRDDLPADNEAVLQWIDRGTGRPGQRFWVLDPIDGTKGFLRREQFATALALIEKGQVRVAVLACPNLPLAGDSPARVGALFAAVRDQGAWMRPLQGPSEFQPVHVSTVRNPARARLVRSVEAGHTDTALFQRILRHLGSTVDPVYMDSQAKYGLLAFGQGELLLRLISPASPDYREKIWDQAAGSLVVEESGGTVTDLDGKALDFSRGTTLEANRGVVASNGLLHEAALSAIRDVEAREPA